MSGYRAREVVDAVQWFKHGDHPAVERSGCLHPTKWQRENPERFGVVFNGCFGYAVGVGDWVIRSRGMWFVWSDKAFRSYYQPTRAKVTP